MIAIFPHVLILTCPPAPIFLSYTTLCQYLVTLFQVLTPTLGGHLVSHTLIKNKSSISSLLLATVFLTEGGSGMGSAASSGSTGPALACGKSTELLLPSVYSPALLIVSATSFSYQHKWKVIIISQNPSVSTSAVTLLLIC